MAIYIKKLAKEGLEVISVLSIIATGISGIVALNMDDPTLAILATVGGAVLSYASLHLSTLIKPRLVGVSNPRLQEDWSL